ncbi:DUF6973 domain-containing protein, partial [Escherichia coli]|uniref:DUF6973 domain-containing protein n=1 Tax=Escherichia coli TaxID=562 RepID=UPI003CD02A5A
ADRNRSHWSTSKTPSYTKSVSWQHHQTFGSTIADVIGKNHEAAGDRQGQPAKERIMDLKNNTVGIACGDFSAKCSDACIEKYNTGQLFGLDGIKADNPIKAKQGSSDASNY